MRSLAELSAFWFCGSFQGMKLLPWLKADRFSRSNAYLGAGARIAANAGFAGADAENAKSAQFDALTGGQGLLEALENGIHRSLRLGPRKAGALDNMMDDVLLNQRGNLAGATGMTVLRPEGLMLQVSRRLWNLNFFIFTKLPLHYTQERPLAPGSLSFLGAFRNMKHSSVKRYWGVGPSSDSSVFGTGEAWQFRVIVGLGNRRIEPV